jgi:cytochrome c peroxidase
MRPVRGAARARRLAAAVLAFAASTNAWGQSPPPPGPPRPPAQGSLKTVPLPQFINASKYIQDQNALVLLGKAFFWDMQTGSDGRMACATCHFHAGADHRLQNQLSDAVATFSVNQTLTSDAFPFHLLSNVNDNRSSVARDTSDVTGSQGIFRRLFVDIVAGNSADNGVDAADRPSFALGGRNVRQVTARNAPTVINAVFNFRNFWDGRASNIFTGFTPFAASDPAMNSLVMNNGQLAPELVHVENSSLASQAVGPPTNDMEMSYSGRSWPKLGKKMLTLSPLAKQRVAPDDSVLGALANTASPGLLPRYTYQSLIQSAFQPAYWNSDQLVDSGGNLLAGRKAPAANTNEFTQAEFNFALFWGLAIQAYEATLVSDNSRYDQFAEGNTQALSSQEQTGFNIFRRNGGCDNCHSGAEFTAASFSNIARRGVLQRGPNGLSVDTGFFRTGVRPVAEDIGLGGVDTFGIPFSIAVQQSTGAQPPVNGVFMTPGLRNAEFTGPYFHDGGQATLEQVVDFYSRGGDFPAGGTGPGIRRLNLSPDDRAALTAFLKSLTDDRVRFERAPFDHPELCVPIGSDVAQTSSDPRFPLSAVDKWAGIPPVGANGNPVPLQTFDELLQGIGTDGSRAHTLADSCAIP